MEMKLKNPVQVKDKIMRANNWLTHADIASGLRMSNTTVAKVFDRGEPVNPATIKKIAKVLNVNPYDIAVRVEN